MTAWCREQNIEKTVTQGDDPKSNGRAEYGVGLYKRKIRTMLKAGRLSSMYWPFAVEHLSQLMWEKAFGDKIAMPTLGARVLTRVRTHARTQVFDARAIPGIFLGPAPQLAGKRGGRVLLEGGKIILSSNWYPAMLEPEDKEICGWKEHSDPDRKVYWYHAESGQKSWAVPLCVEEIFEVEIEQPTPDRRIRGKTPKGKVRFRIDKDPDEAPEHDERQQADESKSEIDTGEKSEIDIGEKPEDDIEAKPGGESRASGGGRNNSS